MEEGNSARGEEMVDMCLKKRNVFRSDFKGPERISFGEEGEGHSM